MITRVVRAVDRLSVVVVVIRSAVFLTAVAALLVAAPAELRTLPAVTAGLVVLAALTALLPGEVWATVTVLVAATGWVAAGAWFGEPVTVTRVLALAGLLYLVHTFAALAAVLPYDAVVAPEVWSRWLLRAMLVVVFSAVLSLLVLAGLAELTEPGTYLAVTLAGLAGVAALTVLLTTLSRRS